VFPRWRLRLIGIWMFDYRHGWRGAGQRCLVFSLESILSFVVGFAPLFHFPNKVALHVDAFALL